MCSYHSSILLLPDSGLLTAPCGRNLVSESTSSKHGGQPVWIWDLTPTLGQIGQASLSLIFFISELGITPYYRAWTDVMVGDFSFSYFSSCALRLSGPSLETSNSFPETLNLRQRLKQWRVLQASMLVPHAQSVSRPNEFWKTKTKNNTYRIALQTSIIKMVVL